MTNEQLRRELQGIEQRLASMAWRSQKEKSEWYDEITELMIAVRTVRKQMDKVVKP